MGEYIEIVASTTCDGSLALQSSRRDKQSCWGIPSQRLQGQLLRQPQPTASRPAGASSATPQRPRLPWLQQLLSAQRPAPPWQRLLRWRSADWTPWLMLCWGSRAHCPVFSLAGLQQQEASPQVTVLQYTLLVIGEVQGKRSSALSTMAAGHEYQSPDIHYGPTHWAGMLCRTQCRQFRLRFSELTHVPVCLCLHSACF